MVLLETRIDDAKYRENATKRDVQRCAKIHLRDASRQKFESYIYILGLISMLLEVISRERENGRRREKSRIDPIFKRYAGTAAR